MTACQYVNQLDVTESSFKTRLTVRDEALDSGHLDDVVTHPLPLHDLSVVLDNKALIPPQSSLIPKGAIQSVTNYS